MYITVEIIREFPRFLGDIVDLMIFKHLQTLANLGTYSIQKISDDACPSP